MSLEDFLLVEEFTAPDRTPLPQDGKRRPIDPGFVLTWVERPAGGGEPYQRTGMVLSLAPPAKAVWVVPDIPCDGEGYAVLVREVVSDDVSQAFRIVGSPGDYLSTAGWQRPRTLPRALVRTDVLALAGSTSPVTYLHRAHDCGRPQLFFPTERVERGVAELAEDCYVFDRWLHPASIRPFDPLIPGHQVGVCGGCLREGRPS